VTDDPNTTLLLGEVRGQLRELIHNMKDQQQERSAIVRQLTKLETVPDRLEAIERRLALLEVDKNRRDGLLGLGSWLLKTPLLGWVVGIAIAAWAFFTGKLGQ
jgi:hypothetical protein